MSIKTTLRQSWWRKSMIACVGWCALSSPALGKKETDPILVAIKGNVDVYATKQSDGSFYVTSMVTWHGRSRVLPSVVLYKAATEAELAGYHRFAIVHQKSWSIYSVGMLICRNAKIRVRFVGPDESVASDEPVVYVETSKAIEAFKMVVADPDSFAGKWGDTDR